jgi:SAM-dependent methyltransferase
VCGKPFFKEPLLRYPNIPKGAQDFPDKSALAGDTGSVLEIWQCSGCGLVQLRDEPVPYYREVVRAAGFSQEMKEFRLKQFGEFVRKYGLGGKKIVEIGCGGGEYLSIMRYAGVSAYGLEQSEGLVQQCRANSLNVACGFVESKSYQIANAPFDAFFILNFLEHLPSPNETLQGIYNNLADGGIGLIEVPNFDMILEKKLFSEFIFDHLFYFTRDTLTTTLRLNGFDIVECNDVWHDYVISVVVKKRGQAKLKSFYNYQKNIQHEIEEYICGFEKNKVAVWGAGHQALAVISLMNLADKIKYVVDSAIFKQGKYTPATHVSIVAPDSLDSDPIDAVIVMAASYSDEVARTIRQKYDRKINIAILRDYGLEIIP